MIKKTSKKGKILTKKEMKKTRGGFYPDAPIDGISDNPRFLPNAPEYRVDRGAGGIDNPKFVPNVPEHS